MKNLTKSNPLMALLGAMFGVIAMVAIFITVSSVTAAPTALPPDGNPLFPDGGSPVGSVILFDGTTCPDGWAELTNARGRYLVGLNPGGTPGSTTGSALSNGENRAVGQHNHPASGLSFSGTAVPNHQHRVYRHAAARIDPPYTPGAGSEDPNAGSAVSDTWLSGPEGAHTPAGSINGSVANSGSASGTNAPYLQLLVCKRV